MAETTTSQPVPPERPPTLLIIDDEVNIRKALGRQLSRQGYRVLEAGTGEEGLAVMQEQSVDLALVDLLMPGLSGQEVLTEVRSKHPRIVCILITAHGSAQAAFLALNAGAYDYFEKPIMDQQRFFQVIRKGLEYQRLKDENDQLQAALQVRGGSEHLIGNSDAIRSVVSMIRSVAKVPVSVLITGESGTGKERVARAIHAESTNAKGPFVGVNCAAIPETLIEGELFGAEKGAYTGANTTKQGYFEAAASGTILLDEIGHMPLHMQVRLLRVVNEREVVRLGSNRPIPINCRILAATHVDLKQAVKEGSFREDLYFRLNVVEISVPPLRERKDDIPLLAWYLLDKYNQEFDKSVRTISPEAQDLLSAHDWADNNVRELENYIKRAMVFTNGEVLEASSLGLHPRAGLGPQPGPDRRSASSGGGYAPDLLEMDYTAAKSAVVEDFSRWYLIDRLCKAGWVITRAAELAGQQRPNMKRLMRKYGIERPDSVGQSQRHHIRTQDD